MFLVLSTTSYASSTLTTLPDSLFAKESSPVVFKFDSNSIHPKPSEHTQYMLVQLLPDGKERTVGLLSDDGVLGDSKKGDGIYSRKVQLYERKGGILRFQVVTWEKGEEKRLGELAELQVHSHPVLQDLLATIWNRIQARL